MEPCSPSSPLFGTRNGGTEERLFTTDQWSPQSQLLQSTVLCTLFFFFTNTPRFAVEVTRNSHWIDSLILKTCLWIDCLVWKFHALHRQTEITVFVTNRYFEMNDHQLEQNDFSKGLSHCCMGLLEDTHYVSHDDR